jgi:hypothetical protein
MSSEVDQYEALSTQSQVQSPLSIPLIVQPNASDLQPNQQEGGTTQLERLGSEFAYAWLKALQGKLGYLKDLFPDNQASWSCPPFANTNAEMKEQFVNFAGFFQDPALTVYGQSINKDRNEIELDFQLSFWYPLPWRPRVIVPGKVTLVSNAEGTQVLSVREDWAVTVTDIMTKQVPPRLWDIFHIFSTPSPEYPPVRTLGRVNRKVTFVELPPSVAVETAWVGPAKFPGPPLLVLPGFALDGELRTSRPNRDPFIPTLPVESSSDSFRDSDSGVQMKRNAFLMHVPSVLHPAVAAHLAESEREGPRTILTPEQLLLKEDGRERAEDQDDQTYTSDVQVGLGDEKLSQLENVSIMRSVTGGVERGVYDANEELSREFVTSERIERRYVTLPRRLMAQVKVKGEVTADKVKEAVQQIQLAMSSQGGGGDGDALRAMLPVCPPGRQYALRTRADGGGAPLVGFQMYGAKACFNLQGQPAMAIYEIQYNARVTNVMVELKLQ